MDYSATLRRGWDITWQNKWLFLLTLLPLAISLISLPLSLLSGTVDPTAAPAEVVASAGRSLLLACVSMILSLFAALLTLVTHAARAAGVARAARGEATGFGRSLGEGWRALPRLLGLALLLYVLPLVLFIVAFLVILVPVTMTSLASDPGQSGVMAGMGLVGVILICCLYAAFVLGILLTGCVFTFAGRGVVLRNLGVMASLRHGGQVLRENLGQIILLALPFGLIYLVFGLAFGALFMFLAFPDGLESAVMTGNTMMINGRLLLAYVVYLLPAVLLTTWQGSTVTLGYLHWTGKDVLGATITPATPPAAPLM